MKLSFFLLILMGIVVIIIGCEDDSVVTPVVREMMTEEEQISGGDVLAEKEHHIPEREFERAVARGDILIFDDATSAIRDRKVTTLLRKIQTWAEDNCGKQVTIEQQPHLHIAFSTREERDAFKDALAEQAVDGEEAGWWYAPIVHVYIVDNTMSFYAFAVSIICG